MTSHSECPESCCFEGSTKEGGREGGRKAIWNRCLLFEEVVPVTCLVWRKTRYTSTSAKILQSQPVAHSRKESWISKPRNNGMSGFPCSPSSTCWIRCLTLAPSSHTFVDLTHGNNLLETRDIPQLEDLIVRRNYKDIVLVVSPTQPVPPQVERASWKDAQTATTTFPHWRT